MIIWLEDEYKKWSGFKTLCLEYFSAKNFHAFGDPQTLWEFLKDEDFTPESTFFAVDLSVPFKELKDWDDNLHYLGGDEHHGLVVLEKLILHKNSVFKESPIVILTQLRVDEKLKNRVQEICQAAVRKEPIQILSKHDHNTYTEIKKWLTAQKKLKLED